MTEATLWSLPDVLMNLTELFDHAVIVHIGIAIGHGDLSRQHLEGGRFARTIDAE